MFANELPKMPENVTILPKLDGVPAASKSSANWFH